MDDVNVRRGTEQAKAVRGCAGTPELRPGDTLRLYSHDPLAQQILAPTRPSPTPAAAVDPALESVASAGSPFQQAALRARYEKTESPPLPGLGVSRWVLLALLLSLGSILLAAACFGKIEATSTAYGALHVQNGPRPVLVQVSGQIAALLVQAGDRVMAGQELARVDATEMRARLVRADNRLGVVREENRRIRERAAGLNQSLQKALESKRALLAQRVNLKWGVVQHRSDQEQRVRQLARQHLTPELELLDAKITTRSTREELLVLKQQIAEIDAEVAERDMQFEEQLLMLEQKEREAEAALNEARTLVELASVRAPDSGWVESLVASAGQVVQSGAALARVVPDGALTELVAFVPAKDAAFVRSGLDASVELPSLPVAEFGRVPARVTRVSNGVADPREVENVLGAEAPEAAVVRVELELVPSPEFDRIKARLRSGARITVRLKTRKVALIVLLFDFARKWYPY